MSTSKQYIHMIIADDINDKTNEIIEIDTNTGIGRNMKKRLWHSVILVNSQ